MAEKEGPRGAILQRDKQTYAIVPRTPVGLIKPEQLEAIATVVRKYNIPIIKNYYHNEDIPNSLFLKGDLYKL